MARKKQDGIGGTLRGAYWAIRLAEIAPSAPEILHKFIAWVEKLLE